MQAMPCENYKPAQPLALRQLNRKYELDHRNKLKKRKIKFAVNFKESSEQLAMEFGRNSSIHGMNRLFQEDSNKYERFFWLLVLIYALLGSVYVCLILSQRFNAGTFQTVVESTNSPVFHIPFPEVKICNENQLNWDRLEEAKNLFMPHENDTEKIRLFEMVISLYDNITFGVFKQFRALEGEPIELVNSVNFTLVFEFMTWRCEELLVDCKWRHFKINCCDIFVRSKGQDGLCWHFNTLSTNETRHKHLMDDKYPWRTGSSGPESGLIVHVMLNEEKHYRRHNKKGIWVAIFEPGVFHKDPLFVPANTETVVEVEPVVYFYDNGTRSLPPSQRKCIFNDERHSYDFKSLPGFNYMLENCYSQCHLDYLQRYCNCSMAILFPTAQYKDCKAEDLLCLAKYNDNFQFTHQTGEEDFVRSTYKGMKCKCIRSCYSFNYVADIRPSFLPAHQHDKETVIDLDIHYRSETMFVYRTSLVFGWVDLMVAFGGIVGLFLGCSLISGMELVYFVFVELPVFMFNELKPKVKTKNNGNRHNKQHNGNLNTIENFQNNHLIYKNYFSYNKDTMQHKSHHYNLANKKHFK